MEQNTDILAVINAHLQAVPHVAEMGIRLVAIGRDWAELALPYDERFVAYEETGVLAGGAVFSLVDTAAGMAVFARMRQFEPIATLDLRLDYLRAAERDRPLMARMECYRMTRSIAFVRGSAHHPDGPVIAHATGTFMRAAPPPGRKEAAEQEGKRP
ncbi:MAG: PaaI family thioesterase [Alphaproteobacteria bacterium]|nr:MAG: PaaI family thioesterase [Alphaproteobacteria bacterium]